jgi:hypothetical protein
MLCPEGFVQALPEIDLDSHQCEQRYLGHVHSCFSVHGLTLQNCIFKQVPVWTPFHRREAYVDQRFQGIIHLPSHCVLCRRRALGNDDLLASCQLCVSCVFALPPLLTVAGQLTFDLMDRICSYL